MKAGTKHLSPDKPAWQSSQDLQGKLTNAQEKIQFKIFFLLQFYLCTKYQAKNPNNKIPKASKT